MDRNGERNDGMHEVDDSQPESFINDTEPDAEFGVETSPQLGDPQVTDPLQTIEVSKQSTANDAVAGEPVTQGVADDPPGQVRPVEGVPDDEENLEDFEATDGDVGPTFDQQEPEGSGEMSGEERKGAIDDGVNIDPDINPDVQEQ